MMIYCLFASLMLTSDRSQPKSQALSPSHSRLLVNQPAVSLQRLGLASGAPQVAPPTPQLPRESLIISPDRNVTDGVRPGKPCPRWRTWMSRCLWNAWWSISSGHGYMASCFPIATWMLDKGKIFSVNANLAPKNSNVISQLQALAWRDRPPRDRAKERGARRRLPAIQLLSHSIRPRCECRAQLQRRHFIALEQP